MTNTKHHLEPIEAIDYLRFIPPELHQEAKDFVDFVTYAPFEKPKYCPHCNSHSFRIAAVHDIVHYKCRNCKRWFTPLSNTPLSRSRNHEEWGILTRCLFAGFSSQQIQRWLETERTAIRREKPLEAMMAIDYPKLHKWWLTFRYETESPREIMPPQVRSQTDQFEQWLNHLLYPKAAKCAYCSSKSTVHKGRQGNQADYYCYKCQRIFSHLHNTHFALSKNIVELPEIYEYVLNGLSDAEIMVARGGKSTQVKEWRVRLMLQLRDLKLDLLVDWIKWKRYCYLRLKFCRKKRDVI